MAVKGKPFAEMSSDELLEVSRMGGRRSGEARRIKRAMKDTLGLLLDLPVKPGKRTDVENLKSLADVKGKNITVEQALLIAQIQKALKGDTQAFSVIRDTSGQRPEDKVDITGSVPVVLTGDGELKD